MPGESFDRSAHWGLFKGRKQKFLRPAQQLIKDFERTVGSYRRQEKRRFAHRPQLGNHLSSLSPGWWKYGNYQVGNSAVRYICDFDRCCQMHTVSAVRLQELS